MKKALFVLGALAVSALIAYQLAPPNVPDLTTHVGLISVPENENVFLDTRLENDFIEAHPLSRPAYTFRTLMTLVNTDPTLAAFYKAQGFDVSCAQVTTLTNNRLALASWRRGSNFGFSSKPVIIPIGETVFTSCGDPTVIVRAKCGNIMKLTENFRPVYPELVAIPPTQLVSQPPTDPEPPTHTFVSLPPNEPPPPTDTPQPPPSGPPVLCCGGGSPPSGPPVSVPEPSSFIQTVAGVLAVFILAGLACRS